MQSDSTRCPNCSTHINLVRDCNDMFCTACNTAFHYVTGLENGHESSNHDYRRWLSSQTPAIQWTTQDDDRVISMSFRLLASYTEGDREKEDSVVESACAMLTNIQRQLSRFCVPASFNEDEMRAQTLLYRVQFLNKEIFEDEMAYKVCIAYQTNAKKLRASAISDKLRDIDSKHFSETSPPGSKQALHADLAVLTEQTASAEI